LALSKEDIAADCTGERRVLRVSVSVRVCGCDNDGWVWAYSR